MVGIQDTFISDDDDDLCPLCIEEMDISDKNFKPCPCGYQICQFCYNNIRQNPELNGLCPACRRKYDDESVEYKKISAEEWKRDHLRQARKEKERKQREREKRETEQQASKKHLAGMRVIQKNLVYVIGLNPNIPTDELHNTLRQEQFFGQYGKIHKIVINKRTNASGNPGIGVYVTFARKEDAARCIAAVDGSINDGKYLRAAYGTTKYCSAYLRGQTCPNPNCMFLHEPGEEADSYTRRDLSAMQHRQNRATPNQTMPSLSAATAAYRSSPAPQSPAPSAPALAPSAPSAASSLPPMSASSGAVPAPVATPSPAPSLPALASSAVPLVPLPSNVPVSSPLPSAAGVAPSPAVAGPWGKVAVTAPRPTEEPEQPMALRNLTKCLEVLSKGAVNFSFSSFLISQEDLETHPIPPYFTFSLTSETRQQAYDEATKALAQHREVLLKDVSAQQPQEPARHEQQTPVSASPRSSSKTATPPGLLVSSPSNAQNAQNSHELLAHLLKGKGSPQPATQPAPVVQPAAAPQSEY